MPRQASTSIARRCAGSGRGFGRRALRRGMEVPIRGCGERLRLRSRPVVRRARGVVSGSRPGEQWDLDHLEGSSEYRGVAHRYCKRAAGADLTNAKNEALPRG